MPYAHVTIGLCKCTPYIERIALIAVFFQTNSLKLLSNRTLTVPYTDQFSKSTKPFTA